MKKTILLLVIIQIIGVSNKIQGQSLNEIYGKVLCDGKGIANVVISDGETCVLTDSKGEYFLSNPNRHSSFIYISTPSGYTIPDSLGIPQFYQKIDSTFTQGYDFELIKNSKSDDKHVLLVHSDPQFFKEDNFRIYDTIIDDCIQTIDEYKDRYVFGIDVGDLVGDKPELYNPYIEHLSRTNIPFYRTPGNHDMNYGGRTHEYSTKTYSNIFGPTRYSFNKGKIHYIVLDNVFYFGRDYFYMGYIDESTFRWLEQDLSYVPEGSTVFISMHIPARLTEKTVQFNYDSSSIGTQTVNIASLFKMLEPYNLHLLTGHMHYNKNIIHSSTIYEHNTAAICGTWWQGDYCLDGTPLGYGVYEIDGDDVSWYFKSSGHSRSHQFRSYPVGTNSDLPNDITVNVWNWDKEWRVEWFENGVYMGEMEQCEALDPKVAEMCADKDKLEFKWIAPMKTDHMFKAIPQNEKSKIEIKVTDRFGNIYQEEI